MRATMKLLLLTLMVFPVIGCGPRRPMVTIAVIGPRDGASVMHLGFFLDGGNPEVQTLGIATQTFAIDFAQGTRGQLDVVVLADDANNCTHWSGKGSVAINDDNQFSITVALAQVDPSSCY
jgi:hypothetical protein